MTEIESFKAAITIVGSVIATLKNVKDLLPEQAKKLEEAETQLQIAEAQAAKGLGYPLCKCTWPPQIMLFTGQEGSFRCGECGHVTEGWGQLRSGRISFG